MKPGPWQTAWFCVDCDEQLTYDVKMYSFGRCPECGYKAPSAGTVVKATERAFRVVGYKSRGWFRKPELIVEWKDES